jgi:GT2 family glycosyltransferase/glycosyltransferase involved in cell wall biosynthesis
MTSEISLIKDLQTQVSDRTRRMQCDLVVCVPIYNAPQFVADLLDDLEIHLSGETTTLFVFADDASPDSKIKSILSIHPFCQRKNSIVFSSPKNQGFLLNVNSVFAVRPENAAMLILNTDVRIYSNIIKEFREIAEKNPSIGSITPLSTNATIASLVNWPHGGTLEHSQLKKISAQLPKLNIATDFLDVPTGIGFCMYMSAQAIRLVGNFDIAFKRGYGEECDWCRRAAVLGFRNVLSLRTLVAHIGTQSFTSEEKLLALKTSEKTLLSKHPNYMALVIDHLLENQLRFFRLNLFISSFASEGLIIQFIHGDPSDSKAGGTELHVRHLNHLYHQRNFTILEFYPKEIDKFGVRYMDPSGNETVELFYYDDFQKLLMLLKPKISFMHIHHFLKWPNDLVDWLVAEKHIEKIFTAHDFWTVCPTINLLRDQKVYCGVEQNPERCENCYRKNRHFIGRNAFDHRRRIGAFFNHTSRVIVPSESARDVMVKGFPELSGRIDVVPHDLNYIKEHLNLNPSDVSSSKKKIAIIGGIGVHKGRDLLIEALDRLTEKNIEVVIIGSIEKDYSPAFKNIRVVPFRNVVELKQALEAEKPGFLGFISSWPETFCYTLFEGILVSSGAIPVVGPFGNPQVFVSKNQVGSVMKGYSVSALLEAIEDAQTNRQTYLRNLNEWKISQSIWSKDMDLLFVEPFLNLHLHQPKSETQNGFYEPVLKSNRYHFEMSKRLGHEFENVIYRFALNAKAWMKNLPFFGDFSKRLYKSIKTKLQKIKGLN